MDKEDQGKNPGVKHLLTAEDQKADFKQRCYMMLVIAVMPGWNK